MAVESPPAPKKGKRSATAAGLPVPERAPPGRGDALAALAAPAPGLGGPAQPQLAAQPRMYAPPPYARGAPAPPFGRGVPTAAYAPPPPTGAVGMDVMGNNGRPMGYGRGAPPPSG
ncbi:Small nuclear ribonucleoprotein-associated protein B [Gracilaria domingensis]|nr:Small nuclear ribonucleoprotein-associated protein B [Gracilaria domingensis]